MHLSAVKQYTVVCFNPHERWHKNSYELLEIESNNLDRLELTALPLTQFNPGSASRHSHHSAVCVPQHAQPKRPFSETLDSN